MKPRNLFLFTGQLTSIPKLSYTKAGLPYIFFSIKLDISAQQDFALIDDEIVQVEHDPFQECIAWGGTAQSIANYGNKGKQIFASGWLATYWSFTEEYGISCPKEKQHNDSSWWFVVESVQFEIRKIRPDTQKTSEDVPCNPKPSVHARTRKLPKSFRDFLSGKGKGRYGRYSIWSPADHQTILWRKHEVLIQRDDKAKEIAIMDMSEEKKNLILSNLPGGYKLTLFGADKPFVITELGNYRIEVLIPQVENEMINKGVANKLKNFFEKHAGGSTWYPLTYGHWKEKGKRYEDMHSHYWCILKEDVYNNSSEFKFEFEHLLNDIGRRLKQESIFFKVNNKSKLLQVRHEL
jgi:hypothetical protein